MTITLHWWHVPTILTAVYFLWLLLPVGASGFWDDVHRLFVILFCSIAVLLCWIGFAVSAVLTGGW